MRLPLFVVAAALLSVSCCALNGRKLKLADTCWTCVYEEFVADAGTETNTVTLTFDAGNGYVLETRCSMPPYPATYVNPDGSIDTHPGYLREYSERGTYEVKRGAVILTGEEGATHTLHVVSDRLESADLSYRPLTFSRKTD